MGSRTLRGVANKNKQNWTLLNTLNIQNGQLNVDDWVGPNSGYDSIRYYFLNVQPVTNGENIKVQVFTQGVWQTSNYELALLVFNNGGGSAVVTGTAAYTITGTSGVWVTASAGGMNGYMQVYFGKNGGFTQFEHSVVFLEYTVPYHTTYRGGGGWNGTSAISGIRFTTVGGGTSVFASGKIKVYGIS
jgi:hypothetical protein